MKKTLISFLLILLVVGQAFAQQQTKSFAEYWFGITPQQLKEANAQRSANPQPNRTPAIMPLSQTTAAPGIHVLDLSNPTVPTYFELHPTMPVWRETPTTNYQWFEFNNGIFSFAKNLPGGWPMGDPDGNISGWSWDGFTFSRWGDNTNHGTGSAGWIPNQFGNMAGGGIKTDLSGNVMKDNNNVVMTCTDIPYIMGFWNFMEIMTGGPIPGSTPSLSINLNQEYEAEGVYINIAPWTYFGIKYGNTFVDPAEVGDYFKLIIHGVDASGNATGTTIEHHFFTFENGNLVMSPNWEWVDLSSLGTISGIFFTFAGSCDAGFGISNAAYFVMDRFTVRTPGYVSLEEQILALQQQVADLEADTTALNATIAGLESDTLRLYNQVSALEADTLRLYGLLVDCNTDNNRLNDTISARDSRIATLLQNISDLEGDTTQLHDSIRELWRLLNECEAGNGTSNAPFMTTPQIEFFPNPVINELHIVIPSEARDLFENNAVELFDMNGRRVFSERINSQFSILNSQFVIDMSPFPSGNYILRIGNHVAQIVKR